MLTRPENYPICSKTNHYVCNTVIQTALGDGVMKAEAHLAELDLSDNAFGPDGVKAVTALLTSPSCFSLKVLKFNNNGLGSKGGSVSYYKYNTT